MWLVVALRAHRLPANGPPCLRARARRPDQTSACVATPAAGRRAARRLRGLGAGRARGARSSSRRAGQKHGRPMSSRISPWPTRSSRKSARSYLRSLQTIREYLAERAPRFADVARPPRLRAPRAVQRQRGRVRRRWRQADGPPGYVSRGEGGRRGDREREEIRQARRRWKC